MPYFTGLCQMRNLLFQSHQEENEASKEQYSILFKATIAKCIKGIINNKKIARLNDLRLPRISWAHSMQAFTPFLKIKRNFGFCLFTLGILIYLAFSVLNKFYLQFLQTVNYDNTFYTRTLGFNHHINDNNT